MYYIKNFRYIKDYTIEITFNDNKSKVVDLENHLNGKIFEPLQDLDFFKKVSLNKNIDTLVWPNNADFSPDFLYKIGK